MISIDDFLDFYFAVRVFGGPYPQIVLQGTQMAIENPEFS